MICRQIAPELDWLILFDIANSNNPSEFKHILLLKKLQIWILKSCILYEKQVDFIHNSFALDNCYSIFYLVSKVI